MLLDLFLNLIRGSVQVHTPVLIIFTSLLRLNNPKASHGFLNEEPSTLIITWSFNATRFGEDVLRQIIVSLEVLPTMNSEHASAKEVVHGYFLVFSVPPAAFLFLLWLEVLGSQWTFILDALDHVVEKFFSFSSSFLQSGCYLFFPFFHRMNIVSVMFCGDIAGCVSPVFE